MAVRFIAKDGFPSSLSRAEAHETISPACQREAMTTALSRLGRALGTATSVNWRSSRFPRPYLAEATS
jgi:hypothetical protein